MKRSTRILVGAALAGLSFGTRALADDAATAPGTDQKASKSKAAKHACKTLNSCKGQGGCGSTKGKNDCKGKGECRTDGKPMSKT